MTAVESEREKSGPFEDIRDFCERLSTREVNRRTVESLIKAGAFDSTGANRHQLLMVYSQVIDTAQQDKKNVMSGQMSLFDIMSDEDKKEFSLQLPAVADLDKEEKLAFEKEVLGIYISGHPLDAYQKVWAKGITARTSDFELDEETGEPKVIDNSRVTVGGIVTEKTIKYTKNNDIMAFITIEDLVGTVEVIVFPKTYERFASQLEQDSKVFIEGRVSVEEDRPAKLVLEAAAPLKAPSGEIWLQFADKEEYYRRNPETEKLIRSYPGDNKVVIYLKKEKAVKRLDAGVSAETACEEFEKSFGKENVRIVSPK